MKNIKQKDVSVFIAGHPTFLSRLDIPDTHITEYFNPTPIQLINIKGKFYSYFRLSLDYLIDEMDKGFDYRQALKIIKAHGFSLPIRIASWGYKEPLTVDELLDKLEKNSKHWERVYDNAVEREREVESKKTITQTLIGDEYNAD
jgi:hypothetical protein